MQRAALAICLLAAAVAAGAATDARAQGGACLTADPPPVTRPAQPIRFGITPGAAGSAGVSQGQVAPIDEAAETRALLGLRGSRELVLRLNRLFWAEGDDAIRRFAATVDRYAAAGLRSEIQVRYHPPEGAEGDMEAWAGFVRQAVRTLGAKPSVVGFSITNEANFPASPNTSDGAYEGVVDALVRGVAVADAELVALGRGDLPVGFNVMWRWTPESDEQFWRDIGAKATPEFRRALDYVGVQVYPGLVWPPASRPGVSAGDETVEALTLIRSCFMPMAELGLEVPLWVTENGYATNLGHTEAEQSANVESTLRAVHKWSGELGVTDYRWFNLRDNNSDGTDLFAAVGLLRDDYSPKPAYGVFGGLLAELGTPPAPAVTAKPRKAARPMRARTRLSVSARLRGRHVSIRGRLSGTSSCGRAPVAIRLRSGRRVIAKKTVATKACRFSLRLRARRRSGLTVEVRYAGSPALAPARANSRVGRPR